MHAKAACPAQVGILDTPFKGEGEFKELIKTTVSQVNDLCVPPGLKPEPMRQATEAELLLWELLPGIISVWSSLTDSVWNFSHAPKAPEGAQKHIVSTCD